MLGARVVAAIGGGGGSIVAMGSRLASRLRMPGRKSKAPTRTRNGSDGTTAALKRLLGEMYPCRTVVTTPITTATPAAIGIDRRSAHAAAAMAVTVSVT